ncbi:hypothetical protein [Neisseria sicca]|nr:hypothetical protein [Neisseria sicca]
MLGVSPRGRLKTFRFSETVFSDDLVLDNSLFVPILSMLLIFDRTK